MKEYVQTPELEASSDFRNFLPFSIKGKFTYFFFVLVILVSTLAWLSISHLNRIDSGWGTYQQDVAPREVYLQNIKAQFGYGGMIHNFKNYVLRGTDKYIPRIEQNYQSLSEQINAYRNLANLSPSERDALVQIFNVATKYQQATNVAARMYQEGKTATEIDAVVKIDDKPALDAFERLNQEYGRLTDQVGAKVDEQIYLADKTIKLGSFVIVLVSVGVLFLLYRNVVGRVQGLADICQDLTHGNGDLTKRIEFKGHDELTKATSYINQFLEQVHHVVSQVVITSQALEKNACTLRDHNQEATSSITRQQAEIEQVATAINQFSATVHEVASSAENAALQAQQATTLASDGLQSVASSEEAIQGLVGHLQEAHDTIHSVESDSEKIGSVLEVIRAIADQTNLLALNAAIEAARAGEHGRGFSVVAEEVRSLANRTQISTEDINKMISDLQQSSQGAVSAMEVGHEEVLRNVELSEQATESLVKIEAAVGHISSSNEQIATAAEEQQMVSEDINRNIHNISQLADTTSLLAQNNEQASVDLQNLSHQLAQLVARFSV